MNTVRYDNLRVSLVKVINSIYKIDSVLQFVRTLVFLCWLAAGCCGLLYVSSWRETETNKKVVSA